MKIASLTLKCRLASLVACAVLLALVPAVNAGSFTLASGTFTGDVSLSEFNVSNLIDISGGAVTGFVAADNFNGNNNVLISGGTIDEGVTLTNFNGANIFDLSGGSVGGNLFLENFNGNNVVTVYGNNLTFSGGFLNGTLQDGTTLMNLGLMFDNLNGSNFVNLVNIIAAVPEPSSGLLTAAGLFGMLGYGWRSIKR